jgi:acyl-CoA thioester hydrolase
VNSAFQIQENAIEGYKFVIKMPIQFRDIDAIGHANNVAYFAFLETARMEYFVQLMDLHENLRNFSTMPFILAGQAINHRTPAFYRETLLIGFRTSWVRRSSFGFDFIMRDEASGRLVAEGNGTHVMYDFETEHSIPMPDEWFVRLENFEGRKLRNQETT